MQKCGLSLALVLLSTNYPSVLNVIVIGCQPFTWPLQLITLRFLAQQPNMMLCGLTPKSWSGHGRYRDMICSHGLKGTARTSFLLASIYKPD